MITLQYTDISDRVFHILQTNELQVGWFAFNAGRSTRALPENFKWSFSESQCRIVKFEPACNRFPLPHGWIVSYCIHTSSTCNGICSNIPKILFYVDSDKHRDVDWWDFVRKTRGQPTVYFVRLNNNELEWEIIT